MSLERRTYEWWIQDGHGTATILCDPNTENLVAYAMVEKQVTGGVPVGMGYRQFKLINREEVWG